MDEVIKNDLLHIKEEFSTPRKTFIEDAKEIVYIEEAEEVREVTFLMDRFGYSKVVDKSVYDKNKETAEADNSHVICCQSTDKICLFTDNGSLHQVKVSDLPFGKLKDKGTPIDNLCKYDGTKEKPVFVTAAAAMQGQILFFATKDAMVKRVPGEEFDTNNRMVAATKLQDDDRLIDVRMINEETEAVLQTSSGVFLRFPLDEITVVKKNSRGVRGIKLEKEEALEAVYLLGGNSDNLITYKQKQVHLNRLKIGKRDGKGSKVRL